MRAIHTLTLATAALLASVTAHSAGYPNKPIMAVVPFTPGGSSDVVLRVMAPRMSQSLGKSVILENKPGANGSIGAAQVIRSRPDGYSILIGSVGTYAITPFLLKTPPYDPRKDFDLLSVIVRTPNVVAVPASFPPNSMTELVEYMKKHPGEVAFASAGIGSTDHLSSLLLWQKTNTNGLHVSYRGGGAAINDLLAGHAQVLISNLGVLAGHIKSGRLKALAVTSSDRVPELPDVPTLTESNIPGMEIYSWQGIAAPRGLPAEAREKLNQAVSDALNDPAVRTSLESAGFEIIDSTPDQFETLLNSEIKRWGEVIKIADVSVE